MEGPKEIWVADFGVVYHKEPATETIRYVRGDIEDAMLEALESVKSWHEYYKNDGTADAIYFFGIESVDAAIAKAKGESDE